VNTASAKYLERAEHALEVAATLAKAGFASDAASKTYYAMFYAAQALLTAAGVEVTKHSAVEAEFGYRFAKTGRIEPRFHRMLLDARKIREIADYDLQEEIVEPAATLKLNEGREFVAQIKTMLERMAS
jgi:uncharacterized protein (UPF0332 family)